MTITFAGLLQIVWRLFRRDRDLLVRVAGVLIFLPAFAALLLCDPVPALPPAPRDEAVMQAWMQAVMIWGQGNGIWFLLAELCGIYGAATLALLLLDPDRLTVGQALGQGLVRLVPFALASMAVAVPVALGLWLLVLPGLYAQARLVVAIPAMARHPALRPWRALRLSWKMTKGYDRAITGALVTLFLVQWIVVSQLLLADQALRLPGQENAAVLALVDAAIAATGAGYAVATLLIGVIVYRVRASRGT